MFLNVLQSCPLCNNYVFYQVTTEIGLNNQTGEAFQVELEGPPGITCGLWMT